MTELTTCPICEHHQFTLSLQCIDHTVSHETFNIVKCNSCEFTFTNPTPDPTALGNYYQSPNYVSHSERPIKILDRVYALARTQTLKCKIRIVKNHISTNTPTILDYGCGTGDFLSTCKANGWQITGIEPSDSAKQIASKKTGQVIYSNIEQIPNNTFDIITLWHVLEHIPNLHQTLQQLRGKLSETGTIFVAVPNCNSWDAKHYKANWAAYDVPRHLWHFKKKDIATIMKTHSLYVANILPMKLDAYYVSLLSEKYKTGSLTITAILQAFANGLRSNKSAKRTAEYSSHIYVIKK